MAPVIKIPGQVSHEISLGDDNGAEDVDGKVH